MTYRPASPARVGVDRRHKQSLAEAKWIDAYQRRTARPVPPLTDHWDWQLQASCRGTGANFFPSGNLPRPEIQRLEYEAKAVCVDCPVIAECRRYAIEHHEPHGIWGGLDSRERAVLDHRRRTRHDADAGR